jgi:putative transposase
MRRVNKRAGESRFWQPRFYDFNVYSTKKRHQKLDYIHRNPVARGIVKHPGEWMWSSYSSYYGGSAPLVEIDFVK